MAIGIGKGAVGVFLLRIVINKIQIWFIYVCLGITTVITLFASITVIVQCSPVEKSWDPMIPGTCWLDFSNVGYTVGCEPSTRYLHLQIEILNRRTSSLVRRRRYRLCNRAVVPCLGSQNEPKGEDDRRMWSQSWSIVSLTSTNSFENPSY